MSYLYRLFTAERDVEVQDRTEDMAEGGNTGTNGTVTSCRPLSLRRMTPCHDVL